MVRGVHERFLSLLITEGGGGVEKGPETEKGPAVRDLGGGSSGGPDSDSRDINSLGPAAHVLSAACDEVLRNSTLLLAPPSLSPELSFPHATFIPWPKPNIRHQCRLST